MNEMEMALLRHQKRKVKEPYVEEDKKISKLFSKILISIIFVLLSVIYIKMNPDNIEVFKKYLFEDNLAFTKINHWYNQLFGNILPTVSEPKDDVVSNMNSFGNRTNYLDGYKVNVDASMPISAISGGILVFMGEKEGYGNTLIIQGADGVDIWYGNIVDTNLKLYDYVDANTILGNSLDKYYYVVFKKDGESIKYEEYQEKISS